MPLTYTDHSPADIVAMLLVELSQATEPPSPGDDPGAWPAYASGEPITPDNCITVYDTSPDDQGRIQTGQLQGYFGFQVRVRSTTHYVGYRKIAAIREALAMMTLDRTVHIEGKTYRVHAIVGIGPLIPIGKDTPNSERSVFTLNAFADLKQVS